jgi:hypothetical protein
VLGRCLSVSDPKDSKEKCFRSENFLQQLNTLLVPGTVISILGVLVDASQAQIALFTVTCVILLCLSKYRYSVNKYVQSYLVLSAVVASISSLILFKSQCTAYFGGQTAGGRNRRAPSEGE